MSIYVHIHRHRTGQPKVSKKSMRQKSKMKYSYSEQADLRIFGRIVRAVKRRSDPGLYIRTV